MALAGVAVALFVWTPQGGSSVRFGSRSASRSAGAKRATETPSHPPRTPSDAERGARPGADPSADGPRGVPGVAALASVSGSVVDEAGTPVVGAVVEVAGLAPPSGSHRAPGAAAFEVAPLPGQNLGVTAGEVPALPLAYGDSRSAAGLGSAPMIHSGADGRFRIDGVPPGPVQLVAVAPGYAPARSRPIALAPGGSTPDIELVLRAGAAITGEVVDERGFAVERAVVRVEAKQGRGLPFPPALSDARGEFILRDLVAGDYAVSIEREGYVRERREATAPGAGTTRLGDVVLRATGSVSGEVVDALGAPVEGAEVALGSPPAWKEAAHSDRRGRFRLAGIVPGEHRVSARHATAGESSSAAPVRVLALEDTPGVVVRLPGHSTR